MGSGSFESLGSIERFLTVLDQMAVPISIRISNGLKSSLIILGVLSLVTIAKPAFAVILDDLYVAEVETDSQSDLQRRRDAATGLRQILIRVSGDSQAAEQPSIAAALRSPERYYTEFSYRRGDGLDFEGPTEPMQIMQIRFEPSLIAELLRESNLPVWGSNRPSVLFWVAKDSGGQREVLGEASLGAFAQSIRRQASARGVPAYFPLWDLEDAATVTPSEIWGRFLDDIEAASERYSPDKILVARVEQRYAGQWHVDWSYGRKGDWRVGSLLSESEAQAATALVDEIAERLSAQYAGSSSKSSISLKIEGVRSILALASVERYLKRLSSVLNVRIQGVKGDLVTFDLSAEGDLQQLVDLMALDRDLMLLNQDARSNTLWYRWGGETGLEN